MSPQRRKFNDGSAPGSCADLPTLICWSMSLSCAGARDFVTRASAGDDTALIEFRASRNATGNELERRRFVVHMEGPESVRESVDCLQHAIDRLADGLETALQLENR